MAVAGTAGRQPRYTSSFYESTSYLSPPQSSMFNNSSLSNVSVSHHLAQQGSSPYHSTPIAPPPVQRVTFARPLVQTPPYSFQQEHLDSFNNVSPMHFSPTGGYSPSPPRNQFLPPYLGGVTPPSSSSLHDSIHGQGQGFAASKDGTSPFSVSPTKSSVSQYQYRSKMTSGGGNDTLASISNKLSQSNESKEKDITQRGERGGPPKTGMGNIFSPLNVHLKEDCRPPWFAKPTVPEAKVWTPPTSYTIPIVPNSPTSLWVTVFGFQPTALNYVLEIFSSYGLIIDQEMNTGSNWVHLKYSNKIESRRALSKNGTVLGISKGGVNNVSSCTIMVGVMPYFPKREDDCEKPTPSVPQESSVTSNPSAVSSKDEETDRATTEEVKSRIRPLSCTNFDIVKNAQYSRFKPTIQGFPGDRGSVAQKSTSAFLPPPAYEEKLVEKREVPLPTAASSSVITKAMEYMFGW